MILGSFIALVVVVMIFAPKHDRGGVCPECNRDFEDETPTQPEDN